MKRHKTGSEEKNQGARCEGGVRGVMLAGRMNVISSNRQNLIVNYGSRGERMDRVSG